MPHSFLGARQVDVSQRAGQGLTKKRAQSDQTERSQPFPAPHVCKFSFEDEQVTEVQVPQAPRPLSHLPSIRGSRERQPSGQ